MTLDDAVFGAFVLGGVLVVLLPALWLGVRQRKVRRENWWSWESFAAPGVIMTAVTVLDGVSERQWGWSPIVISGGFAIFWLALACISYRRQWTGPFTGRRRRL